MKQGKFGQFLACSGYPECNHTQSLNAGTATAGIPALTVPGAGCDGHLLEKKSRRGKSFTAAAAFPQCTYAIWDKPVAKTCPRCGGPFLVEKSTKRQGTYYACLAEGCGFQEPGSESVPIFDRLIFFAFAPRGKGRRCKKLLDKVIN